MVETTYLEKAQALLSQWAVSVATPEPNRLDVEITPDNLLPAIKVVAKAIVTTPWGSFSAMTGLDLPPGGEGEAAVEGQIEVLYHFCMKADVLTIRTRVPYSHAVLDSICDALPSATLYEREMMEMFGIDFTGTPSRARLLLADDWPGDVFPLRKSFTGMNKAEEEVQDGSTA